MKKLYATLAAIALSFVAIGGGLAPAFSVGPELSGGDEPMLECTVGEPCDNGIFVDAYGFGGFTCADHVIDPDTGTGPGTAQGLHYLEGVSIVGLPAGLSLDIPDNMDELLGCYFDGTINTYNVFVQLSGTPTAEFDDNVTLTVKDGWTNETATLVIRLVVHSEGGVDPGDDVVFTVSPNSFAYTVGQGVEENFTIGYGDGGWPGNLDDGYEFEVTGLPDGLGYDVMELNDQGIPSVIQIYGTPTEVWSGQVTVTMISGEGTTGTATINGTVAEPTGPSDLASTGSTLEGLAIAAVLLSFAGVILLGMRRLGSSVSTFPTH